MSRDRRGLVKVNPLANWTDLDVDGYIADHDVPVNPLLAKGYPSIGCWPCTRPVRRARTRPGRPLGGARQDGVRPARRVAALARPSSQKATRLVASLPREST